MKNNNIDVDKLLKISMDFILDMRNDKIESSDNMPYIINKLGREPEPLEYRIFDIASLLLAEIALEKMKRHEVEAKLKLAEKLLSIAENTQSAPFLCMN